MKREWTKRHIEELVHKELMRRGVQPNNTNSRKVKKVIVGYRLLGGLIPGDIEGVKFIL